LKLLDANQNILVDLAEATVVNMNKFKQWWHETDSIEMVLFATIWSLFGYGAYVVILELIDRVMP
jgi:hypothetical protein